MPKAIMTDYRVKIYKQDKRHNSGERLEVTYDYLAQTDEMFQMVLLDLKINKLFTEKFGYRIQHYPSKIVVRNLMSGEPVELDADTPWSCRPDSETYWSM
jgi:hypothetical protein